MFSDNLNYNFRKNGTMFMRYLKIGICSMCIFINSCTPVIVAIDPIPEKERIQVLIQPMEDLTGQYKSVFPTMDSLITLTSSLSLVDMIEPDEELNHVMNQVICQNPIRLLRQGNNGMPKFKVSGEVEIISYGPLKDIDRRIATYSLFGLIGLAVSNDNDLAAYVQYRIYVKDSHDNQVDSFLVIGISSDDPYKKSRKQLMSEANLIAAYNFQSQFTQCLIKQGFNLITQNVDKFSEAKSVEHALAFMKNLLNPKELNKD